MNIEIVSNGAGVGHVSIDGEHVPMVTQVNVLLVPGQADKVTLTVFGKLNLQTHPEGITVVEETYVTE